MGRAVCGDRGAFESLVRRHERRVFRVSLAILGNAEDAEEAMQDSFVKAYRHLAQFRCESKSDHGQQLREDRLARGNDDQTRHQNGKGLHPGAA